MILHRFQEAEATARAVAERIRDAIRDKPDLVLGLPAGRSPVPVYEELRRMHAGGEVDFSRVTMFNLDEFVGLDRANPRSFAAFMWRSFLDGVGIDPIQAHALNGSAHDLEGECRRYDEAIAAAGGIDLQLLGLGTNGHIGFNEPGDALAAATHRVALLAETRAANAALFGGDPGRVPVEALTMGMRSILGASRIVLLATGESKARAVAAAISGPVTTRCPASFLQLHGRAEVYADRLAAAALHH